MENLFKRHIALPTDHGSWVFLFSPLTIGVFTAPRFSYASIWLILTAIIIFLIRQPITVFVKIYSGRRSRSDLPAAVCWILVYGLAGLTSSTILVRMGFPFLLWLAVPGFLVFTWHLFLVSKRAERRQVGVEIVATGVLALAAPAAYWVAAGNPDPTGWWLFLLSWLQSAASIVYAYLRLEQRVLPSHPDLKTSLNMGRRALIYTTFNLLFVLTCGWLKFYPIWLFAAYLVQWLETIYGILYPAVGWKPTRIGIRQLIVSILFTMVFILAWNLGAA